MSENNGKLPEAGGVAWTDLYTPKGNRINLTARGASPKDALDELMAAIRYAYDEYGLTGASDSAPAVAQVQPQADGPPADWKTETKTFMVETATLQMTPNGVQYVNIKGGPFKKFGVKAWPEVAVQAFTLDDMEPGKDYNVDGLRATVQMNEKGNPQKVVALEQV